MKVSLNTVQVGIKPRRTQRVKLCNSPKIGLKTIHVNPIDELRLLLDSLAASKLQEEVGRAASAIWPLLLSN